MPGHIVVTLLFQVRTNHYIGNIFTIYELINNEEYADSGNINIKMNLTTL